MGFLETKPGPKAFRRAMRFVAAICLGSTAAAAAVDTGALRLALLPSDNRASIVVSIDEDVKQTAIDAVDDRTVIVEIGPVSSKVANEVLEAPATSLVNQVRVRGVTMGRRGTLVTIQVTGRSAISATVRHVRQRVYIDLEPLIQGDSAVDPEVSATVSGVGRTLGSATHAPSSRSQPSSGASSETKATPLVTRSSPGPSTSQGHPRRSTTDATRAAGSARATVLTDPTELKALLATAEEMARALDVKGLESLAAMPVASLVLAARLDQLLAETRERTSLGLPSRRAPREVMASPPARPPAEAATLAPAPVATSQTAVSVVPPTPPAQAVSSSTKPTAGAPESSTPPAHAVPQRAAATSPPAVSEPARSPGRRLPNARVFRRGMRELKPDLEQLSGTMNVLSPGSVVAGELAIHMETTLARLQSLDPPEPLSATHKQACEALSKLLGGWVKAPNGELVLAVGSDPESLDGSRTRMRDYLLAFDSFEAQSSASGQQN